MRRSIVKMLFAIPVLFSAVPAFAQADPAVIGALEKAEAETVDENGVDVVNRYKSVSLEGAVDIPLLEQVLPFLGTYGKMDRKTYDILLGNELYDYDNPPFTSSVNGSATFFGGTDAWSSSPSLDLGKSDDERSGSYLNQFSSGAALSHMLYRSTGYKAIFLKNLNINYSGSNWTRASEIKLPNGLGMQVQFINMQQPGSLYKQLPSRIIVNNGLAVDITYDSPSPLKCFSMSYCGTTRYKIYNMSKDRCDLGFLCNIDNINVFGYEEKYVPLGAAFPSNHIYRSLPSGSSYGDLSEVSTLLPTGGTRKVTQFINTISSESEIKFYKNNVLKWYSTHLQEVQGPSSSGVFKYITIDGIWTYRRLYGGVAQGSPPQFYTERVSPDSKIKKYYFNNFSSSSSTRDVVTDIVDENGLRTKFDYYGSGYWLRAVTYPDGTKAEYQHDARGNIIEIRSKSADLTIPDIVRTAQYYSSCSVATLSLCDKPLWTRDAKGNQTDFTWSSDHGGLLTRTEPAGFNGVRAQVRYEYAQRYAWIKGAGNTGYVQAASPIWLRTKEEFCKTSSAVNGDCAGGAADEVVTQYDYGLDAGPNNLLLRGIVVSADGTSLRTCYGYDAIGRRISETKPMANLTNCT